MGKTSGCLSYLPWKYCAVWISPVSGADAPRDKIGFLSERKFGKLSLSEGKSSSWRSMALYALRIFKLKEKIVSDPFTTKVSGKWTRWEASSSVLPKSEWEEVYHLGPWPYHSKQHRPRFLIRGMLSRAGYWTESISVQLGEDETDIAIMSSTPGSVSTVKRVVSAVSTASGASCMRNILTDDGYALSREHLLGM